MNTNTGHQDCSAGGNVTVILTLYSIQFLTLLSSGSVHELKTESEISFTSLVNLLPAQRRNICRSTGCSSKRLETLTCVRTASKINPITYLL